MAIGNKAGTGSPKAPGTTGGKVPFASPGRNFARFTGQRGKELIAYTIVVLADFRVGRLPLLAS